ncbi:MAG: T9SS type A sorting domain-containing protein, partial [bacterium]
FHTLEEPPYPNPFHYGGESEFIYFPYSLTENSQIALYLWTSAGDLVYYMEDTASKGLHLTRDGAFAWRPANMRGDRLSTGIYIYKIQVETDEYIGKISIVNP